VLQIASNLLELTRRRKGIVSEVRQLGRVWFWRRGRSRRIALCDELYMLGLTPFDDHTGPRQILAVNSLSRCRLPDTDVQSQSELDVTISTTRRLAINM
jgi:hypothetical protein